MAIWHLAKKAKLKQNPGSRKPKNHRCRQRVDLDSKDRGATSKSLELVMNFRNVVAKQDLVNRQLDWNNWDLHNVHVIEFEEITKSTIALFTLNGLRIRIGDPSVVMATATGESACYLRGIIIMESKNRRTMNRRTQIDKKGQVQKNERS